MTDLPAYATGLFCAVLLAVVAGWKDRQLFRVAAVVLLNWMAGVAFVTLTGDYTPWLFNIAIDSVSAWAILFHPAGRQQGYIGLFYFFQIASHIAFGGRTMAGFSVNPVAYYNAITWIAWAQLLAIGAWGGGILLKGVWDRFRDRGHAMDIITSFRHGEGQ